jgi:hypothetical protein
MGEPFFQFTEGTPLLFGRQSSTTFENSSLLDRVVCWRMEPPALSFEQLIALVGQLRDRVAELERENARLLGELDRLKKDKPASGPPPFVKASLPAWRKSKKPGRPAGHEPALRPPPPEIHQEIQVPLARGEGGACLCPHCSGGVD